MIHTISDIGVENPMARPAFFAETSENTLPFKAGTSPLIGSEKKKARLTPLPFLPALALY